MPRTLWAVLTACLLVVTPVGAQAPVQAYAIPTDNLKTMLDAYARQSRRELIYRVDEVQAARGTEVKGEMSADQALQILLTGSGFVATTSPSGAIAIVRAAAPEAGAASRAVGAPPDRSVADEGGRVEEVIVTGTKQAGGVSVHDAALAVTAFSTTQLEESHVRDLSNVSTMVPNVVFSGTGTYPGTATFSIRGMAVNNTIPSNTPTVGVFTDGIYAGVGSGLVLDMFDMEGIEVLRGPQGLLFGRNVTAGAVLLRTTRPTGTFRVTGRAAVETGPNFTGSGSISGPLTQMIWGKIAAYRSDDSGWFRNLNDGKEFGEQQNTRVNAALTFGPDTGFSTILRYQYAHTTGDGPAVQDHGTYSRHSFDFNINLPGSIDVETQQVSAETTREVSFGNGQIVNILGYRKVDQTSLTDFDGTPQPIFVVQSLIEQHQWSDELRYSGTFGRVGLTTGVYYYTDELFYLEGRTLFAGASDLIGGGKQESDTYAAFGAVDIGLAAGFTLNLGARYSQEEKTASVNRIMPKAISSCSINAARCSSYGFNDSDEWSAFTPKVGIEWSGDTTNAYAFWTKGHRSGGYNLRQASAAPPGPYDQETEDSYEIGLKQLFLDRAASINLSAFINKYKNLQRDISRTDPVLGSVQVTANTADATIEGVEAELSATLIDDLRISLNLGYLHSSFDQIYYDLSGNAVVGPEDYALKLPMFSPWSYGINISYGWDATFARLSARAGFNHRDKAYFTDSNVGYLNPVDNVEASVLAEFDNGVGLSIYGKNLTDQATYGMDVPLPFVPGETHSPLNKGRVLGFEIRYTFE